MKPKFLSLVLEDDPLCAEILREVVRAEGGEAVVCATVRAAEEAVERLCFDVLILDNMLPDGTGADFFRALQERGGTPRAIMLTGMPNLEGAVELTRGGLFDYLAKPVEVSEFTQRLRRVLGSLPHLDVEDALSDLVAQSVAMRDVRRLVQQAAQNRGATVLLTGETGSGKDLVARSIHRLSFP
ncbi:MAG: response regulator, partial [Verrucomicrobia bacterium]|nr:response regulator [Verrucomicrobiota bacterium]